MSIKTVALKEKLGHIDSLVIPIVVDESATYKEVVSKMAAQDRGSVIVTRKGAVVGIWTERDLLFKCVLEKVKASTPIGELMTPKPIILREDDTLGKAIEVMHEKGVRNLPLVDAKGKPKAIVTVGRVIRYLADHFPAEVVNLPPVLNQVTSDPEGA
ncbi:MAG: CBS domain-containing protein [Elusimicrobia bacterium]|nr:CBS domain-containing protein [Elusimicrobiota bacterium]